MCISELRCPSLAVHSCIREQRSHISQIGCQIACRACVRWVEGGCSVLLIYQQHSVLNIRGAIVLCDSQVACFDPTLVQHHIDD